MIVWPSGKTHSSTCGLMLIRSRPELSSAGDVDLVVEVADVADDRLVLHAAHVVERDDVLVARRRDEDVGLLDDVLERLDLVALHRGLERADRVDLGDDDAGALGAQRLGRALADVAEAADDAELAGEHHVDGAVDAVDERVAAAVEVVELRLRDRVVDVDRREQQVAGLLHLVEPVDAGRRLLGDALDAVGDLGPLLRVLGERVLQQLQDDAELLGLGAGGIRHGARAPRTPCPCGRAASRRRRRRGSCSGRRRATSAPARCTTSTPRASRPSRRRPGCPAARPACRRGRPRRRGGVVLRREDVARGPADLGTERDERLDQDGGLDRHVQRPGDARALQRLRRRRTRRGSASGPASRARRAGSPCGRSRPARGRRPCSRSGQGRRSSSCCCLLLWRGR